MTQPSSATMCRYIPAICQCRRFYFGEEGGDGWSRSWFEPRFTATTYYHYALRDVGVACMLLTVSWGTMFLNERASERAGGQIGLLIDNGLPAGEVVRAIRSGFLPYIYI